MNLSKFACLMGLAAGSVSLGSIAAAQAADITVMGYRGVFQDHYQKQVIDPFNEAHPDIKVTFFGVQNAATSLGNMRAQKSAPQANAVIYDLSVARIASEEELVADVDTSKLSNYADLADIGKELGGKAIPITYDTLALVYSTGIYKDKVPTSWEALWDPAQKGKVIIPAQGGGDIQAILFTIIANKMAGSADYKEGEADALEATINPGVEKLVELAPNIQTWEPKPDQYTLIANGTASIGVGWNARSQTYFDQTEGKVSASAPEEGTATQVNVISAIANAPEQEATEAFINYAISPEVQARFAKAMYYAPTNSKAEVDEETKKRIPLMNADQQEKLIPVDWMTIGELRDSILEPWRRQIIPASR
ncbi:extracellular solute-binding protein [Limoniibacter endophyticus]|uniref:Polyamine ABC transporter substrate-binding protein n=1 Tax=Limoniibacter endophyticus TaxID=1565040 RepID=A0A8J3GJF8_9HYPH|nr:extracellular solute-binding protein [Limoniibacter endophyticus]GHC77970.1 polyamine ABC transporter substrate-binding protein [Limoniibacter endophyticus]